jgi:transposase
MANELDDIRAQANCPVCGFALNLTYKTLRLRRTVECQGCGETIRPIDETPIGKVQALIDEVNKAA